MYTSKSQCEKYATYQSCSKQQFAWGNLLPSASLSMMASISLLLGVLATLSLAGINSSSAHLLNQFCKVFVFNCLRCLSTHSMGSKQESAWQRPAATLAWKAQSY
jgi:hypothetical protein